MIIFGLVLLVLGFFRRKQKSMTRTSLKLAGVEQGPDFWTDWLLVVGGIFLVAGLFIRFMQFTSTV